MGFGLFNPLKTPVTKILLPWRRARVKNGVHRAPWSGGGSFSTETGAPGAKETAVCSGDSVGAAQMKNARVCGDSPSGPGLPVPTHTTSFFSPRRPGGGRGGPTVDCAFCVGLAVGFSSIARPTSPAAVTLPAPQGGLYSRVPFLKVWRRQFLAGVLIGWTPGPQRGDRALVQKPRF